MKTISRRLHKLEKRFAPQENEDVRSLVALLWARRRRRAEACGEPFEVRPSEIPTDDQNRPLSIADILRRGRRCVASCKGTCPNRYRYWRISFRLALLGEWKIWSSSRSPCFSAANMLSLFGTETSTLSVAKRTIWTKTTRLGRPHPPQGVRHFATDHAVSPSARRAVRCERCFDARGLGRDCIRY
jgi:hypothetical protein